MTDPKRSSEFCFLETLNRFHEASPRGRGETKLTFSRGTSHFKMFCYTSQPKNRKKNAKKSFAWRRLTDKCGFKELDLITCESKVRAFVELGDITTAFITLGVKESQVRKPKKTSQHVRKIKTIMAAHCGVPHNSKIEES